MGIRTNACRTLLVLLALISLPLAAADEPALPIIPGAHGFGMETPAGSGRNLPFPRTRVIKVTNLNDDGPGSLRAALAEKGPRVVVFEVSGYIDLKGSMGISNPYVTVAGQTAPWPGIIIRGGWTTLVGTHDVLIQHLTFRPGDTWEGRFYPHRSGLGTRAGVDRVVIDHCSFGWSTQVGVNLSSNNSTVRHCIFSEGLYGGGHMEPNHSKGLGVGLGQQRLTRENIAVIGNLFAHNKDRNPVISIGTSACHLNNVAYNYGAVGFKSLGSNLTQTKIFTIAGNVYIPGVDTGAEKPDMAEYGRAMWLMVANPKSRVFISPDNLFAGKTYDDPWESDEVIAHYKMGTDTKPNPEGIVRDPAKAFMVPGYKVLPARETEAWVLANAGPFPACRNPIDARTIYEVRTRTGRGRDHIEDAGSWPKLEEKRRAFNVPNNPNGDDDGDGYTNLEELLHAYADEVEHRLTPAMAGADPDLAKHEAERCATPRIHFDAAALARIKSTHFDWAFDAKEAKQRQEAASKETGRPVTRKVDLGDGVAIDLVLIPAGEFVMGSKYPPYAIKSRDPKTDVGLWWRDSPMHPVKLTKPFYMAKFEVTQAVWEKVMGKSDWKKGQEGPQKPAHGISWGEARWDRTTQDFIKKLNRTLGPDVGLTFRLPTEAEWEWACRAGTDTPFYFGETISLKLANYNGSPWDGQGVQRAHLPEEKGEPERMDNVGSYPPNAWGLYDMSGNISEWVQDAYAPYPIATDGPVVDPTGATPEYVREKTGVPSRVIRGGNWQSGAASCRSGASTYCLPHVLQSSYGFRLAADPAGQNEAAK